MRCPLLLAALLSFPLVSADRHLRFARMTLAEGPVEVEHPGTGERMPGERNLPVGQGFWVETQAAGRAEIELDEGSVVRLGPSTLAEFSDLTRLSTGQRISLVSLERGTLYATAEPAGLDAFVLVVPGLQINFLRGARVRLDTGEGNSALAVLEGRVHFSSPAAEMEIREGHTVQLDPQSVDRFQLFREVTAGMLDDWNEQRDREAAGLAAGTRLAGFPFSLGEIDAHGQWIEAASPGKVWQPRVPKGWAPFRLGRWRWYDALGYTWISSEPWGWLPYHYGGWTHRSDTGWVWAPGAEEAFHAGMAYWLRAGTYVAWGPLEPAEQWSAQGAPALYSSSHITFAAYQSGARLLDPALRPNLPADPLAQAQFVTGLPAPPAPPAASAARPRKTRAGTLRIRPISADQTYNPARQAGPASAGRAADGIRIVGAAPAPAAPAVAPPPGQTYYYYPVVPPAPAPEPEPQPPAYYYPPVYGPGVVAVERERRRGDRGGRQGGRARSEPPGGPPRPVGSIPSAPPSPAAPSTPPPRAMPRPPAPVSPPASEPVPGAGSEGPERHVRVRNPEAGDAPVRRR